MSVVESTKSSDVTPSVSGSTVEKKSISADELKELVRVRRTFKKIVGFVKDLESAYGKGRKQLTAYSTYLSAIGHDHIESMKEQLAVFGGWCSTNSTFISNRNLKSLTKIVFKAAPDTSTGADAEVKITIDLKDIMKRNTSESNIPIWNHLFVLLEAFSIIDMIKLKKLMEDNSKEDAMLEEITNKVQTIAASTGGENPQEILSAVMNGGLMNDLLSGASGIKAGKMMKSLKKLLNELPEEFDDDEDDSKKTKEEKEIDADMKKARTKAQKAMQALR